MMFGINARFVNGDGTLSNRSYTYLSEVRIPLSHYGVVEANGRFAIVKIVGCQENPVLKQNIQYKHLKVTFNAIDLH